MLFTALLRSILITAQNTVGFRRLTLAAEDGFTSLFHTLRDKSDAELIGMIQVEFVDRKIQGIKHVREVTGLGLKDSKDLFYRIMTWSPKPPTIEDEIMGPLA